ncbi:hypothetical protein BT69DRAFT_39663 [Atractiella rhizophila]|nr:hypothetical protein BT69DRAFT_39663 [Atractiella rhizophila]
MLTSMVGIDIGDFYTRCGQGWKIHNRISSHFSISSLLSSIPPFSSSTEFKINAITTTANLSAIASIDIALLRSSLLSSTPIPAGDSANTAKVRLAVLPTAEKVLLTQQRSNLIGLHLSPPHPVAPYLGVEIGDRPDLSIPNLESLSVSGDSQAKNGGDAGARKGWAFAYYLYDYADSTLTILRLRLPPPSSPFTPTNIDLDLFLRILRHAAEVGNALGLQKVEVWNLDERLLDAFGSLPPKEGEGLREEGKGREREDSWPCLAWYGPPMCNEEEVEWVLNERYSWS